MITHPLGSLTSLRQEIRAGQMTALDLVDQVAAAVEARDGQTHAYLSMDLEAARLMAKDSDPQSVLAGIPIAIKDNIAVYSEPMRCASKILESFVAPYDATAIVRLKASGGIPLGRMNMDEFAMGSTGENSAFGRTLNPVNPEHVPGGSSSGSAAAVADGTAVAALGSDTGGSIRQPAAYCGIVGLKPTYGRISRYGLTAFGSSLDQIGPLTSCVSDAAILLNVLAGQDARDATSMPQEAEDFERLLGRDIKGLRIGLPKEYFTAGNDPVVTASLERSKKALESLGAELVEVSLPHAEAVVATYYLIACAEASSNLSRYDGIRYGNRAESAKDIIDLYHQTREAGFGREVKKRIILGTYVLSSGYYDAYYARAQRVRSLVAQDFSRAFEKVDFILGPTTPAPAPKLGAGALDPLQTYLADIYTIPANLAGLPAMSIPCCISGALPTGVQLLAPHFAEASLLSVAYVLEQALV